MNIGIYFGSFNPVHFGHVTVARRAIEDLTLDKLLVLPVDTSPFGTVAAADLPRGVPADSADFLASLRVLHRCAIMLAVGKQTMRFVYEFSNNSIPRQA